MDVFELRKRLTEDYADYASSFIEIRDERISSEVHDSLDTGLFWPDALIQINPTFETGGSVDQLIEKGLLHRECSRIFRKGKTDGAGAPLYLHRHQRDAIEAARQGHNYILTTGTGSGKSLAYIVPIVDHVLRRGSGKGIQAIIVYPMNALANSQAGELQKFLNEGYAPNQAPVTFARYTGQENEEARQHIIQHPPDILLTNYVMLELIMTRPRERKLIERAKGLRFLVLDELHTYRGRQGADVALLMRRVRNRLETAEHPVLFVGTSATLASEGSYQEQQAKIAHLGEQIFGAAVEPDHVIGETLRRTTASLNEAELLPSLKLALAPGTEIVPPTQYHDFVNHPLSAWIESVFGLKERDGKLVRQQPRSITGNNGAGHELSRLTGIDERTCADVIQRWLLASYECDPNPITGQPPFAFRLHQFISPGDTVYTTIEPEDQRYITLNGQRFVPGEPQRQRLLFPLCFCRECGQEYYTVRLVTDEEREERRVEPRSFSDRVSDETGEAGYLYISTQRPWPQEFDELISGDFLPDDWIEEHAGTRRIRRSRKDKIPYHLHLSPSGFEIQDGQDCVYISAPFMFCLNCAISYAARQSEFGKLATLSSEGRSSATTLLSLSAIRSLKSSDLPPNARKLLSFTDNRQDASLQAGHFNDFIDVSLLRGAIYRAVEKAGAEGLTHEVIAERVFEALNLPLRLYASDPNVRFGALQETQRALRQVLGYRIYNDLRRGWRISLPNLEQCGLLEIDYVYLDTVCEAEDVWSDKHAALATASPQTRRNIAKTLLDHMRRELAIKVDYLDKTYQEKIAQWSSQHLVAPWAIDEAERDRMTYASIMLPRSSQGEDGRGRYTYVSGRGGFGMYLRRVTTLPEYDSATLGRLDVEETEIIIRNLLEGLRIAGLVEITYETSAGENVPGYQLVASAMLWRAGTGTQTFHDPIRVPNQSSIGGRPNRFFVDFYRSVSSSLVGIEAREHTAQVPYDEREKREEAFRSGDLPILYCSPTMELGVDIAELNVVNMRNVPPTPANYAQRSGRAGRSGQPALVFTYCSGGSPHDQYFFRRPEYMVSGAVTPPRLDLTNEDLLRAHIHAIWLSETGIDLSDTLTDILDMNGTPPSLELLPEIRQQAESPIAQQAALQRARQVLSTIQSLDDPAGLLEITIQNVVNAFDTACERWRDLYTAAHKQAEAQGKIQLDPNRSQQDKKQAKRLRDEALSQIDLLTRFDQLAQSDFYSYRYFATEGFLPGYSFPRLPLSAFIPARRLQQRDEFLSRPRFLAISEFGPRAIIYHEGSRYLINRVILPITGNEDEPMTSQIKQCSQCGYIHPANSSTGVDLCQRCGTPLDPPLRSLLRLQNVVTVRRDRINADEEERLRLGYEIRTGLRFKEQNGKMDIRTAIVSVDGQPLVKLTYAQTATLWRINLGWARRKNKKQYGFVLDFERGYWVNSNEVAEEEDPTVDEAVSALTRRVIPYVEDNRNCLIFEPFANSEIEQMASLQAALKRAIETLYQLEDNELAAEPLPDSSNRQMILFYEAAEGGAGALRRLVDEPEALAQVAHEALLICHYDPETGDDMGRGPRSREDCEAACYDCLLSYNNQREHPILDRKSIRDLLGLLMRATVASSPSDETREEFLEGLLQLCDSDLERDWLKYLHQHNLRLPDKAQVYMQECQTRPDFLYSSNGVYAVIYIDGSPHDFPQRQMRDLQQSECMEDIGYRVIRFGYRDDWDAIFAKNQHVFGSKV